MFSLDGLVILFFLLANLIVGIKAGSSIKTLKDYSFGSKNYLTLTLVITIFATYVDVESLIFTSSHSYSFGIISGLLIVASVLNLYIISLLAPSIYDKFSNKISIGEITSKFYGENTKIISGLVGCVSSVVFIAMQFRGVSILINYFFKIDAHFIILMIAFVVISYSAFGGVRSITWTDLIKFVSTFFLIPITFSSIFQEFRMKNLDILIVEKVQFEYKNIFNYSGYYLSVLLPTFHPPIIQRVLMSSSKIQAKDAMQIASIFVGLFLTIVFLSGMICNFLNPQLDPEKAIFFILENHTPVGIKGLLICGILSIIISSADSYLNTSGISLYNDVIRPFVNIDVLNKKTELMITKYSTAFIGLAAFLLSIFFNDIPKMMFFTNMAWGSFITIPLLAVLLDFVVYRRSFYVNLVCSLISISLSYFYFYDLFSSYYIFFVLVGISVISFFLTNFICNFLSRLK